MTGDLEQTPSPGGHRDNIMQVSRVGCDRNSKSGAKLKTGGRWYHTVFASVKAQVAASGKWNCGRCRSESLRRLDEKLQKALFQIDEQKRKSRAL
jgi:hypothetical protein